MASESNTDLTDQQLVFAINQGESEAFETLYYRYRDWVMRLAWRFTGNETDALDVLQETFAYVVRKFPGFELTASMTTFLYPAVRNLAIAANRRRRRFAGSDQLTDRFEADNSPQADRSEWESLLGSLSDSHREILLMRFVDDMTQPEIAAALDIPLGTVKSRLHHAVEAVRRLPQFAELFDQPPVRR